MSGSSARRGGSPTSRGVGSDAGDDVGGRSLPGSAQGTPVHVPMPPSTDGTPSTAYLERARNFAERMQASMASAVKEDQLYNALAASPATESFASARAKELMEELIEAERRRDDGALRFEEDPNDLADRIARLANEPPRTGREDDAESGAHDARGSYDEGFDERFGDALDAAAPSVSFAARVEHIPPPTVDRRSGDARRPFVDGREDTAGGVDTTNDAGVSSERLARPLRAFVYGDGDASDVSASLERDGPKQSRVSLETRAAPSGDRGPDLEPPEEDPVASTTGRASAERPAAALETAALETAERDASASAPNSGADGGDFRSADRFALFAKYLPEDDASGLTVTHGRARRGVSSRGVERERRELERVRAENAALAKKVSRLEKRRAEDSEKLFVSERERKSLRSKYVAVGEKLEAVSRESAAVADAERDAATRIAVLESRRVEAKRRIRSLEKALERATRESEAAKARDEASRARAEAAEAAAAAKREAEGADKIAVARLAGAQAEWHSSDLEARKEIGSLRDALDLERRERGAAERALAECETKLARAAVDANAAEESARRAAMRADAAAIEADAAIRRKVALEEQRLSVEAERRAFEMETAFARRERARDRELDELKLELDRAAAEAAAAREKTLALPAPNPPAPRPTRAEPSEEGADETTVAAKLARAVLRALDERAPLAGATREPGLAAGVPDALAETRRVAEEARAAAGAALKSAEDQARRRETEALVEARLEARLAALKGTANRRDGDSSGASDEASRRASDVSPREESVFSQKFLTTDARAETAAKRSAAEAERAIALAREDAATSARTAEAASRSEAEQRERARDLERRADAAERALEEVRNRLDAAETRVAERVAEETSRRPRGRARPRAPPPPPNAWRKPRRPRERAPPQRPRGRAPPSARRRSTPRQTPTPRSPSATL